MKAAIDATFRTAPRAAAISLKTQRQLGQRPHIEIDHRQLLDGVQPHGGADEPEARVIDQNFHCEPRLAQRLLQSVGGSRVAKVQRDHERLSRATRGDFRA
jgi:hypothetical protein